MKRNKKTDPNIIALKIARKMSREEEIKAHGKPVNHNRIKASKKVYNRKRNKKAE